MITADPRVDAGARPGRGCSRVRSRSSGISGSITKCVVRWMYARFGVWEETRSSLRSHNRHMTTGLLLTLAVLVVVDSTSFGTLGIPVYLLLAAERSPVSRLLIYLGTVAVFYFLVGVTLMLGLSTVLENFGDACTAARRTGSSLLLA
jgi:hypothetical protein